MIKSFALKLIIALSLFSAVTYMSMNTAEATDVTLSQDLSVYNECSDLRASIVDLFLTMYAAKDSQINLSEYIAVYNSGVQTFNLVCTLMMNPLEEIQQ